MDKEHPIGSGGTFGVRPLNLVRADLRRAHTSTPQRSFHVVPQRVPLFTCGGLARQGSAKRSLIGAPRS